MHTLPWFFYSMQLYQEIYFGFAILYSIYIIQYTCQIDKLKRNIQSIKCIAVASFPADSLVDSVDSAIDSRRFPASKFDSRRLSSIPVV